MCNLSENAGNEKVVENLLALWIHQNEILWSRVQLISAIQGGVVAGWYTLFVGDKYWYAALLSLLGSALSVAVFAVIDCDLDWRHDIKTRLEKLDRRIFPVPGKIKAVSGYFVIRTIAICFFWLDVILLCVSIATEATLTGGIESAVRDHRF